MPNIITVKARQTLLDIAIQTTGSVSAVFDLAAANGNAYIKGIDFDGGRFIPALLTDALQQVSGVQIPQIDLVQTRYAALPFVNVPGNGVVPDAGYLRINDPLDLQINFMPWQ
jgi:hypothetical protein